MTHALNLPLILDKVFYNLAKPCHGIYHPDSWMYNPEVELLGYDPAKSAALLDEAGWRVSPTTGWRSKEVDGTQVPFEFTMLMPQESPTSPKIAAIMQDELKQLGVRMEIRKMEWSSFLERVRKHEFQAEIAAWGTGTDPDTGWNLWRTEEYEDGRNYGAYSNPRVDELFQKGREAYDFEERKKIYQEIHKIVYDDQPYTFIYNRPILAVFNKRLRGVQFSPRGIFNFTPSVNGWWVASGQAKYAAAAP
jgi:peptide/nickel transport system substrate-binding protein